METRIRGVLSPKASGSITITENGNYDVVDVANAIVNVVPEEVGGITPEGSITLTSNGVYDVTMYAEVVVDVENVIPEGYVKPSGTLNVTSNGTFDVTEKKNVSVNVPIPDGYIIPSGTLSVTQVGTYDVSTYASATFSVITETKTVTPSVSSQSVTPSSGKYLSQVTVNPIPDNYIIPSGTIEITENGVVDVTNYANANVNVASSGGGTTLKGYLDLVKTMQTAFKNNASITDLSTIISYNDTENVTSMYQAFWYCENLEIIPPLNTKSCKDFYQTFYRCFKVQRIELSYFYSESDTKSHNMCYQCNALKYFIVREFGEMYALGSNAFANYTKILVPRAMVETLKSATNWSLHGDYIFAVEDYTIDGTTTGALDESKLV